MTDTKLPLEAVEPTLGIYPGFVRQEPTTLIIKEHFTWGDPHFTIYNDQGEKEFEGTKVPTELHHSVLVSSEDGSHLYTVSDKLLTVHKTFVGRDAQDETRKAIFQLTKNPGLHGKFEMTFVMHGDNHDVTSHRAVGLLIDQDFWGGSAQITYHDRPIAQITKEDKLSINPLLTRHQTYRVDIAPGVDVALIAAVCICMDGMKNAHFTGWMQGEGGMLL